MDAETNRLMGIQLMNKLRIVQQAVNDAPRPRCGWIRSIRKSLRMTGAQLAKRLNVNRQRVSRIEQDEKAGNVTLKTMRQVAEAMDCSFQYWLVPNTTLQETLRRQAKKLAERNLMRTSHTMALEAQNLSDEDWAALVEGAVDTMMSDIKVQLWEDE